MRLGTVFVCLCLLFVGISWAAADDESLSRAKELFRQGRLQYNVGRYPDALVTLKRALVLARRPSIIFNIAQCYRQLDQPDKALHYYKLYRTLWSKQNPRKRSPYHDEVENRITQLSKRIGRDQQPDRPEPGPPDEREALPSPSPEPEEEIESAMMMPGETAPPARDSPFYKRWWFWSVVGVVVAGAVTATVIALQPEEQISAPMGTLSPGQIELD